MNISPLRILCKRRPRFNRYMVECELLYQSSYDIFMFVLIDTWWNVNEADMPEWYKQYGF